MIEHWAEYVSKLVVLVYKAYSTSLFIGKYRIKKYYVSKRDVTTTFTHDPILDLPYVFPQFFFY